jgi:hypothetical protein
VPIAALERLADADTFRPSLGPERRDAVWGIRGNFPFRSEPISSLRQKRQRRPQAAAANHESEDGLMVPVVRRFAGADMLIAVAAIVMAVAITLIVPAAPMVAPAIVVAVIPSIMMAVIVARAMTDPGVAIPRTAGGVGGRCGDKDRQPGHGQGAQQVSHDLPSV